MQFGFPEITDSFLRGQDIVYTQFNDIEFYVEDIEQENFYFEIFKKLFPNLKFEKIFPLGGKSNVFTEAGNNRGNKKKIYIVDLDFDEILGVKNENENIFYLERYSIENYLLQIDALTSIIIEERPKIKHQDIFDLFDFNAFLDESKTLFAELICRYLVIQKHELGIENVKNDTARFCDFTVTPAIIKSPQLVIYHNQIEIALRAKNSSLKINTQINLFKKHFRNLLQAMRNIPGKYLLNFLKYRIEHLFGLPQMTLESFTYRLAKNSEFDELLFLKQRVTNYIT